MLRIQARARQAQLRAQRQQMRAHRRSLRRVSIVGPLIILVIGIVCLLAQMGKLSWARSLEWYGKWWPAVLIAVGVVLLLEWVADQRRSDRVGNARVVGGGVVFLLILLTLTGLSSRAIEYGLDWRDHTFGNGYTKLGYLFGDRHDADSSITAAISKGSTLVIRNPHGDVAVSGSSSDGQVHVNAHTQIYAWKESDVHEKARQLHPAFSNDQGVITLNVNSVEGGQVDLTVELPISAPVTIQADYGDVTVSQMSAPVMVTANHGDVDLNGINNSVTLHINDDDASVSLHSIRGPVSVEGHSGDIEISDVIGDLMLQGDFFGATDLEHVSGAIHFTTSRTQFSAGRLDDDFSVNKDSLNASQLIGPVILKSTDKNITLDRIQGPLDVTNRNGSVEITSATPLEAISIHNEHGSVDLGLPGRAGFELKAETRNGDLENDFGLTPKGSEAAHTLQGTVGVGGPAVTIVTSDGDITVRRSTVAPLSPTPAAPVRPAAAPTPPKAI